MMFILFLFVISCIWLWKSYNKIIIVSEKCNSAFSNIDTELARRVDLYLRATEVLETGSEFEKGVYTKITELRTRQDLSNSEKVSGISNLLAVVENNPDIKSIGLFDNMQQAVSGTETRIQEARQVYNNSVNQYNIMISQIPMKFAAHILKFKPRDYFQYTA